MGDTRQNTHLIRDVKDPVSECAKVAAYIERTKELNKSAAWPDFAILGRTHERHVSCGRILKTI